MKVGDLVYQNMSEQFGIIVDISEHNGLPFRVFWTTQGDSLFGPGSEEWCGEWQLGVISEGR